MVCKADVSPRRAAFYTLGCKLNYAESSTVGTQFTSEGYEIVPFDETAHVYVINTCTVTENAEKDCRQIVRRALRLNPSAFVIVTGCYAQLRPDEIASISGVDMVLGSNEKFSIFNLEQRFEKKELACIFTSPKEVLDNSLQSAYSSDSDSRTRAFLKIQDGCDYKCTFCTIPFARGASRSLPVDEVVTNFRHLLDVGFKEIVLTGVNVGDYGKSLCTDFTSLLTRLMRIEGDFRIRISSIEPNLLTDEIIFLAKNNAKLCNHFHIPLQSGSDTTLRAMQRRYTAAQYRERIERVKELLPDAGIGIDVIVGFPGETEDDFNDTRDFIASLPVSYLHVFTYSSRPDTKASVMPSQVDYIERKERNKVLRRLSEVKRKQFLESFVGKELEVLFEREARQELMKGFSRNYIKVSQKADAALVNNFSLSRILSVEGEHCTGVAADRNRE